MIDLYLFAGHDPGSLNHMRPVAQLAEQQVKGDESSRFQLLQLRPRPDSGKTWPEPGSEAALKHCRQLLESALDDGRNQIRICVMGISTNQAELDMVRACKEKEIPTCVLIDFMAGHRLEGRDSAAFFPGVFMVTNEAAAADIKERYGVGPSALSCVGSTYLESLVLDASSTSFSKDDVHEKMGVISKAEGSQALLVPFFVSPDDMVPEALSAIPRSVQMFCEDVSQALGNAEKRSSEQIRLCVVLRLHPRNSAEVRMALEGAVAEWGKSDSSASACSGSSRMQLLLDLDSGIDNKSLCRASLRTVSMGSTLGVESAAWGAPSAFYQRGWDVRRIETIMGALPVPRIREFEDLEHFLGFNAVPSGAVESDTQGATGGDEKDKFDVENCHGAIERAWQCISGVVASFAPSRP